jgi:hypothetical protein
VAMTISIMMVTATSRILGDRQRNNIVDFLRATRSLDKGCMITARHARVQRFSKAVGFAIRGRLIKRAHCRRPFLGLPRGEEPHSLIRKPAAPAPRSLPAFGLLLVVLRHALLLVE